MSGPAPLSDYGRRVVRSPLTEDQLKPPEPSLKTIQFCTPLSDRELLRLAAFLREYPSLALYVYRVGRPPPVPDLEFLQHFSFLKRLSIGQWTVTNFDGLRHLRPHNLTHLSISAALGKPFRLPILAPFTNLEALSVERPSKQLDALAGMQNLTQLRLRSLTVPTLRPLAILPRLRELTLTLGGTSALEELANVKTLASLELTMIRGLHDLSVLAEIHSLEQLRLRTLKHVTALPSLRPLRALREVRLDQLRALRDMRPIADAPALRIFGAIDMQGVPPETFEPFVGHPTLEKVYIGLGSDRANRKIRAMFSYLPEPAAPPPPRELGL